MFLLYICLMRPRSLMNAHHSENRLSTVIMSLCHQALINLRQTHCQLFTKDPSCTERKLDYEKGKSTHNEHLLDVELVIDAISEDILVLPHKGDVGVSQIHPLFLQGRGRRQV